MPAAPLTKRKSQRVLDHGVEQASHREGSTGQDTEHASRLYSIPWWLYWYLRILLIEGFCSRSDCIYQLGTPPQRRIMSTNGLVEQEGL